MSEAAVMNELSAEELLEVAWRFTPHTYAKVMSAGRWQLYHWLEWVGWKLAETIARGNGRLIINCPPRHGKALEVSTPIATWNGWKAIIDLEPGDVIFSDNGLPCRVIAKSPIWTDRPLFRVSGKQVDPVWCDGEHEWVARLDRKESKFRRYTAARLAARTSSRRPLVQCAKALQLPEILLPADPYVLGLWLGDGSSHAAFITSGDEDRSWLNAEIQRRGYKINAHATVKNYTIKGFQRELRFLGVLRNKHIPSIYLRASIAQRWELLQGLIDSDGHVAPDGQVEFCNVNEQLALGVLELIRSLGVKANMIYGRATLNGIDCGPKFRVMFYAKKAARLPRKAKRCKDGMKTPGFYLDIIEDGRGDTVCIQVDAPSQMFLAGTSMIPTHNSEFFSHWTPTWFLDSLPTEHVLLTSYESGLACDWGRKVRNEIERNPLTRIKLREDSTSASRWHTPQGGGMETAGVGGPITGKGGNLIICDDPQKNWSEANSPLHQERLWDWFTSTLYTRLEPGGTIIVVMQRWNEDDLTGKLLQNHEDDWDLISLPALAEADDIMGRAIGEPLCPERYDKTMLDDIRRAVGEAVWCALYQQRPSSVTRGRAYESFNDSQVDDTLVFNPALALDLSFDFNIDPGMHIVIGQHDERRDYHAALDEITGTRMNLHQAMDAVATWIAREAHDLREIQVFGDASGHSESKQTSESDYDIVAERLRRLNVPYRIRVPKAAPPQRDSLNAMNEALKDLDGKSHYHVHSRCVGLIKDFHNVRRGPDGLIVKSNKMLSHFSDCERYRVTYLRPVGFVRGQTVGGRILF